MKGFENYLGAVGKKNLLALLFITVFGYEIVRDFALFHYHPLIKFEDSKKLAYHQKPACFMTQC